jgi:sporulation protein YlmC with PRC-barrel domain
MRKTLLTAAAVAALTFGPAIAQDATQPPMEPMPAPGLQAPAPETGQDTTVDETIVKPKFLAQQETTELLASSLLGQTVYSPTDEDLGQINDLAFNEDDGRIVAVIVGVGGFLGIGEKNVAVSYDAIVETTDAEGNMRLVLDTNVAELDAAPPFITVAQLEQEKEMEQMQQLDPGVVAAPEPVPTQ